MTDSPNQDTNVLNSSTQTEKLEDQNIFFLLGVIEGTDAEKEEFLDELQEVIWSDFLDNDSRLLLTTSEYEELKKIKSGSYSDEMQKQEAIVVFLEKLIPDLEDIMMEKALQLKADMVRERVAGMREYFVNDQAALTTINEAEGMIQQEKWYSAADKLNSIAV